MPVAVEFQSTHPLRGATLILNLFLNSVSHFNPRTPCGVRLAAVTVYSEIEDISIHAPLAGCDIRTLAHI